MKANDTARPAALTPLVLSWAALVCLTFLGLGLSEGGVRGAWFQLLVAALVWFKGWIVARYFVESHLAHPFIATVVRVFILCVPLALVVTALLGERFARLATL